MAEWLGRALGQGLAKIFFEIPLAALFIQYLVWLDLVSKFDLPNPTFKQSIGIAMIVVFASPWAISKKTA